MVIIFSCLPSNIDSEFVTFERSWKFGNVRSVRRWFNCCTCIVCLHSGVLANQSISAGVYMSTFVQSVMIKTVLLSISKRALEVPGFI